MKKVVKMGAKMCSQMEKIIKNLKIRSLDLQNESLCSTRWRKSLKIFKTEREPISHKKSLKWEPKCAPVVKMGVKMCTRWRKSLKIFKTERELISHKKSLKWN